MYKLFRLLNDLLPILLKPICLFLMKNGLTPTISESSKFIKNYVRYYLTCPLLPAVLKILKCLQLFSFSWQYRCFLSSSRIADSHFKCRNYFKNIKFALKAPRYDTTLTTLTRVKSYYLPNSQRSLIANKQISNKTSIHMHVLKNGQGKVRLHIDKNNDSLEDEKLRENLITILCKLHKSFDK